MAVLYRTGDPSKPFEHPDLAAAAKTWTGEWWKMGGGGTTWDAMAYDADADILYVGTGNGGPWTQIYRSPGGGDNLYLALRCGETRHGKAGLVLPGNSRLMIGTTPRSSL